MVPVRHSDLAAVHRAKIEEIRVLGADVEYALGRRGDDLGAFGNRDAVVDVEGAVHDPWERLGGAAGQGRALNFLDIESGGDVRPGFLYGAKGIGKVNDRIRGVKHGSIGAEYGIVNGATADVEANEQPRVSYVQSL